MRKKLLYLFLCSLIAATSFLCWEEAPFNLINSILYREAHQEALHQIRQAVLEKRLETLPSLLTQALSQKHPLSFAEIASLAQSLPDTPFAYAVTATQNILALPEKTGLSLKTVLPIALFAETLLHQKIQEGCYFFPKELYGRELEYDPEFQRLFIHLKNVPPIGKGRCKIVTKTVLYDRLAPKVLARGFTSHDITAEIRAMKALRGAVGVIQAEGFLSHKQGEKTITSIVTPIYNKKSLQDFLDASGLFLSLKERIQIALDLITGLASIHERSFVHRDLGAKNSFVHITKSSLFSREIHTVIADLERARPVSIAGGLTVQGNSMYLPPEGFFKSEMKGTDYYKSDIFALGCVFWQLYFGELPPWARAHFFKKESLAPQERCRAHLALLNKTREPYLSSLSKKNSSPKDRFLSLILQMTSPDPEARGTAETLKNEFSLLLSSI